MTDNNIKPMPAWTDPAIREWFCVDYPAYVARIRDIQTGESPRQDWNCDNRAEVAARKRELATVAVESAVRLMREADQIERGLLV
jgi:hypothetical protein